MDSELEKVLEEAEGKSTLEELCDLREEVARSRRLLRSSGVEKRLTDFHYREDCYFYAGMRDMVDAGKSLDEILQSKEFNTDQGQVLALAEECGEFVGAYRRWAGLARRSDTFEHVSEELADVIITAYITAARLNIGIEAAIEGKIKTILSRGWREETP